LFIKGASLEDVAQLSYKEDGSPDYLDIGTATKNTCGSDFLRRSNNTQNIPADVTMCIFVEGEDVKFSSNGLEDPLAFMAFAYLDNKIRPTPTCTDKAAHSGIIAVHLFDDYGRDYHLPVFHLKWNVNHRWAQPPGIGCFWNDDGEMDLIQ